MQGKPPPWRPPFSSRLQLVLSNDPVDHRAVLRELRLEPRSDLPFGQRSANYEFPMHLKSNFSTAGLFLLNLAIYTDSQDSWSLMRCRTVQTAFCNYSPRMSVKNPHKSNLKRFWHSRSIVKIHNICTYVHIYIYICICTHIIVLFGIHWLIMEACEAFTAQRLALPVTKLVKFTVWRR